MFNLFMIYIMLHKCVTEQRQVTLHVQLNSGHITLSTLQLNSGPFYIINQFWVKVLMLGHGQPGY